MTNYVVLVFWALLSPMGGLLLLGLLDRPGDLPGDLPGVRDAEPSAPTSSRSILADDRFAGTPRSFAKACS